MRPLMAIARATARVTEPGGPGGGGLRLFRAKGKPKVVTTQQRALREHHAALPQQSRALEITLPLRSFTRAKFPALAAKFGNYKAIHTAAGHSARLFRPFPDAAARLKTGRSIKPLGGFAVTSSPLSAVLGYTPALRPGVPAVGRMAFSTVASIARARFASDATATYGWARYGALGLLLLSNDEEESVAKADLRVPTSKRSSAKKARAVGGSKKIQKTQRKATPSKYFGMVRGAAQLRATARKVSYQDLMRQVAWRSLQESTTTLSIALYSYAAWDLEGFVPTSMLWSNAQGTVPVTAHAIDCLRRALDQDGTISKLITVLDAFSASGEVNDAFVEIGDGGEITLKLLFPGLSVADLRQKLSMLGLDPDDHLFEIGFGASSPDRGSVKGQDQLQVIVIPPGPPQEMHFDDEWDSRSTSSSTYSSNLDSWMQVPPSELRELFGQVEMEEPFIFDGDLGEDAAWGEDALSDE
ncbi:hypothetical protein DFJ74DRAFT_671767 [Hyaloraphidium curvatum]|nr:hypothetical protein DFJ74DRAFT_671767 [Hyaloraphidium curvatum]